MPDTLPPDLVGCSAIELAALVRSGAVAPRAVVEAHLRRIEELQPRVGAFQLVRAARALAEADALAARPELPTLPLAGVPIAVKDNLPVAGEPTRFGSAATSEAPAPADHEVVRRLRAAGAVVVGKTRVPELSVWATSDGVFGVARNPWALERTPGGSSGGSAAAVASGMVPLALGNDGLGSIRIPAACCGLVGLKPGAGVVPAEIGSTSCTGMAENGVLATTAEDAALGFQLLAGRTPGPLPEPSVPLRLALSLRSPAAGVPVARSWARAAEQAAEALRGAGHELRRADPSYPPRYVPSILGHWFAGATADAQGLDPRRLEPRTRRQVALGRAALRLGLTDPRHRDGWRAVQQRFFRDVDVLLTPALARDPIAADHWSRRGWLANLAANMRYAPFAGPWNFAGFPAIAVPAGVGPGGLPLSVQLVAAPGGEALLLALAAQLQRLRPWPRHAPI